MMDSKQWFPILKDLASNYNTTVHSSIKTTPEKAYYMKEAPFRPKPIPTHRFKVSDKVRKKIVQKIFDKPTERWTKTIYEIQTANKRSYVLKRIEDGVILKAPAKPQDLQLIKSEVQSAPVKIKDAPAVSKAIKVQNIEKLHKQLDNDVKKILPTDTKRVRKTNSKYKDFI
jgi:hypothetical protein